MLVYFVFLMPMAGGVKSRKNYPKVLMILIISGEEKVSKSLTEFLASLRLRSIFKKEIGYPGGLLWEGLSWCLCGILHPLSRFEVQSLFQSYKIPPFTGDVPLNTPTTIEASNSEGSESRSMVFEDTPFLSSKTNLAMDHTFWLFLLVKIFARFCWDLPGRKSGKRWTNPLAIVLR